MWGLSTAAAGMLTDERYQQLLSNNLANMETPGFKASSAEELEFPQQLIQSMNYGADQGAPIGELGTGVLFQEGVPVFTEGQLSQTGRNLDVAIVDQTLPGTYVAVTGGQAGTGGQVGQAGAVHAQSVQGTVTAGAGGRLQVNGQAVAVVNSQGNILSNVYAMRNSKYQGSALYAADGEPDYDANGNPSYVYTNKSGQVIGVPGGTSTEGMSLKVGSESTMGDHSFYPVAYQSPEGASGIALTHDGSLDVNAQNVLVDASGHAILPVGANGKPVLGAHIVLNSAYTGSSLFNTDGSPMVDAKGQPSYRTLGANGQVVPGAKLGTVNADVTQLTPLGQTEFQVNGTFNPTQVISQLRTGTGALKPGELEQSNVDPTVTMTQMLAVVNQYQANQMVIETESNLLGDAVTDVGRVNA